MELGETSLGIPQMIVAVDAKQGEPENQLAIFTALCALKYGVGGNDKKDFKAYRDVPLPSDLTFDMEVDECSGYCTGCGAHASFIERSIVEGRVWHRSCMKCVVCKRQLYRGCFHGDGYSHFECIEHVAGQVLFDNPSHQFNDDLLASCQMVRPAQISPPPRPPPPRLSSEVEGQGLEDSIGPTKEKAQPQHVPGILSISQQIEQAASIRHDSEPSMSTRDPNSKPWASPSKGSTESANCERNWEVLSYPVELNPFGSDDDEDVDDATAEPLESEISFGNDELTKSMTKSSTHGTNPFSDETDSDSAEELENPTDRVRSSPPDARTHRDLVSKSPKEVGQRRDEEKGLGHESAARTADSRCSYNTVSSLPPEPNSPPPQKPPRLGMESPRSKVLMQSSDSMSTKKYFHPLAPMVHRAKKLESVPWLSTATMGDLLTQLRKLHSRMGQLETTGKRLEIQILRAINNGTMEWKKNKLVEEYILCVERKCESLRIESVLVRKYLELFIGKVHEEVERQMASAAEDSPSIERPELEELLALLMHMKNELLTIETIGKSTALVACKKKSRESILKMGVKSTLKNLKKKL